MMTRRQAIKKTALLATVVSAGISIGKAKAQPAPAAAAPADSGPFKLPPLPYAYDALEPHIDTKTMQIHHDKHHGTYVANLNKAVAGHADFASKSVEDLVANLNSVPEDIRMA